VPRKLLEHGILVSNWGNLISHTVAEHALLLMLACLRNLPRWQELSLRPPDNVFRKISRLKSQSLRGKRVGLHGFGAIARELTRMLRPHQVTLQAYSHGMPPSLFDEYDVHACGSLTELFTTSDVLLECEGLNDWSQGTVTETILRLLPHDAVFVNVGRGKVVADEQVLIDMAREERLRVGLDVYHREPLPLNSPLRGTAGILLSPHVAGPTWDTYPLCGEQALENVRKYLRGEPPAHLITPELYDWAT
jgi:phosphoglycerate dehydrogenase-like enzyme